MPTFESGESYADIRKWTSKRRAPMGMINHAKVAGWEQPGCSLGARWPLSSTPVVRRGCRVGAIWVQVGCGWGAEARLGCKLGVCRVRSGCILVVIWVPIGCWAKWGCDLHAFWVQNGCWPQRVHPKIWNFENFYTTPRHHIKGHKPHTHAAPAPTKRYISHISPPPHRYTRSESLSRSTPNIRTHADLDLRSRAHQ